MTLEEYKETSKKQWHIIAKELSDIMATYCRDHLYLNRLNRLRSGTTPTQNEVRALLIMTKNKVDSFK